MYRFALRPRWIASHLLVLGLVVLMVNLGFWQLRRLDERRTTNAAVAERAERAPVPLADVVAVDDDPTVASDLEWTAVRASGTWLPEDEVLVRNRTQDGQPGYWVLTPLDLGDGSLAVVNRGWVPLAVGERGVPVAEGEPPAGEVEIEAVLQPTQVRGSFGPTDPADGTLDVLSRADVARLGAQLDEPVLPVLLQLRGQVPGPSATYPDLVPLPTPDEGPHRSYAVQWFTFTTIALVGYPLILRRRAHELAREGARHTAGDPPGDAA